MKEIKLSKGKVALVDDEDYEFLNQFKWSASSHKTTSYATRSKKIDGKKHYYSMHRVVMNTPKGLEVDHIDHNGLNNQKSNLRNCTLQENKMNQIGRSKSGYRGVTYVKHYIAAQFPLNGKTKHLGMFKTEEEAARAYDEMAKKHYGEFAHLNFPLK